MLAPHLLTAGRVRPSRFPCGDSCDVLLSKSIRVARHGRSGWTPRFGQLRPTQRASRSSSLAGGPAVATDQGVPVLSSAPALRTGAPRTRQRAPRPRLTEAHQVVTPLPLLQSRAPVLAPWRDVCPTSTLTRSCSSRR